MPIGSRHRAVVGRERDPVELPDPDLGNIKPGEIGNAAGKADADRAERVVSERIAGLLHLFGNAPQAGEKRLERDGRDDPVGLDCLRPVADDEFPVLLADRQDGKPGPDLRHDR